MGSDPVASDTIDHNSINLWEFGDIWTDLDSATSPTRPTPANFDDLSASHLEEFFAESIVANDFDYGGGSTPTPLGNEFLILVGKDGDIEIDQTGSISGFDGNHADNQFKVFKGEVTAFDNNATASDDTDDTYSVSFDELGTVDRAEADITTLTADEFGFA
jgi:hypothetical protein